MIRFFAFIFLSLMIINPGAAWSQQRGNARSRQKAAGVGQPGPAAATGENLDYREEMRKFIQSISEFSHKLRPDFAIIARGGLELLVKRDEEDETKTYPARTYIQSINGILVEGLNFGIPRIGMPPPDADKQKIKLNLVKQAKDAGLKVLVLDYAKDKGLIDKAYRRNKAKGYVSFAAPTRIPDIATLPEYPRRPYDENAASVLSLKDVRNFLVIGNSAAFGRQDEFSLKMKETNYDAIIVNVFHGRLPLGKRAVETLKYKGTGGKRMALAFMDIGTAASYRFYWKKNWREGYPSWISAPVRGNPDKFNVEYWNPEWRKIITGNFDSYIYGIINQGFDGVVLSGLDTFKYFETGENPVQ
ncbi:MAG TPA: hypothetical protein ENI55_01845 [Alphaproteobacteria bacterium]|nr:hypothetical protein [Alphaproteobacteria bacterium]